MLLFFCFLSHLARSRKMKVKSVFSIFTGIISLALVFGTMAASCDNGTTDEIADALTYSSATEDLVITFPFVPRAALPNGTRYEIYYQGNLVSRGTIVVDDAGADITFKPSRGAGFKATISGNDITFQGSITITTSKGESITISGKLTLETYSKTNPFVGTWDGWDDYEKRGSVTVTETTWRYSEPGYSCHGTYTHIGNTATYNETGNSDGSRDPNTYVTRLINGAFHTQDITFSNKH
jgi:hypothetical protein